MFIIVTTIVIISYNMSKQLIEAINGYTCSTTRGNARINSREI